MTDTCLESISSCFVSSGDPVIVSNIKGSSSQTLLLEQTSRSIIIIIIIIIINIIIIVVVVIISISIFTLPGLSLSSKSPVTLFSTPVAHYFVCEFCQQQAISL